jgi:peroxiredoxin
MPVNVGDKAPDFELDSTSGQKVKLSDFSGKKKVLLAFYPLDFTGTCTSENCAFSEDWSKFESADTVVLPVSVDSIPTHQAFREKHALKHHLLSDFHREVAKKYAMLIPEKNFAKRAYFLIDKEGIVRWSFVEPDITKARPNSELLAQIGKL